MTKKVWARSSAQGRVPDCPVRVVTGGKKYTGRGLGWAKKPVNQRAAKRIARYRAGRILTEMVQDGWAPADLVSAYGKDGLEAIREALGELGWWLESTGDAKGRPVPTQGRKAGS